MFWCSENCATRSTSGYKYTDHMRSFQQNSCHQNTVRRDTRTLTDVFYVTSSIHDFRAHIFCPQTTQELPKKHHEAGPPGQLPTDVLSQIDYGHTRHGKDCKEVCLCQRTTQRAFWKIWVGVCAWLGKRWAPPPPPPPLPRFKTFRRLCMGCF